MESFEKLTNISVDKEGDDLYIYAKFLAKIAIRCYRLEVKTMELFDLTTIKIQDLMLIGQNLSLIT